MKKLNKEGFSMVSIVIVIAVIILAIVFAYLKFYKSASVVSNNKEGKDLLIGFSITTLQEEIWQKDKAEFLKKADEMGATVDLEVAQISGARCGNEVEN